MSYTRKSFQELDVINNFMFNQLTTCDGVKEGFCRCLIKNLLGKKLGAVVIQSEKLELPDDPDRRGIRLDVRVDEKSIKGILTTVYDIEPHRTKEDFYPKKNRLQQALIDKNIMQAGDNDFSKLPELFIICITDYDPFGYDQMVYTFRRGCREVPELIYEDEVVVIHFNTKGTKGGNQSLRDFLNYLGDSRKENVVDEATREMDSYMSAIKQNDRIGGAYMTVGEWFDEMLAEALKQEMADRKVELEEELEERKAKLEKQAEERKAELEKQAEEQKAELEKQAEEQMAELEKQAEEQKAELEEQVKEKDEVIASKDKEIAELKAKLEALK